MDTSKVRHLLDKLIETTNTFDTSKIPSHLLTNFKSWNWGAYGWTSPASLIVTAAWVKYYIPTQDCCKLWARDEANAPIIGGYSIRSEDEGITIPLLSKYDLCKGFCSENSGMQGSRAIEKMRSLKRLDTNFSISQRTVFDLKLFASILNKINNLNQVESLEVLKLLIVTSKEIRDRRIQSDATLSTTKASFNVLSLLEEIADPELTKCVAAACLDALYLQHGFVLDGVTDHKTAADARAEKAGDLTLSKEGVVVIASEVKAKSITLDWQNIGRAEKILEAHPSIANFIFILENRNALADAVFKEIIASPRLSSLTGMKISFLSLHDLYRLAVPVVGEVAITARTGKYLSIAPSVKPQTKDEWIKRSS